VISAYVLAFGGFLLPAGRAADLWGRRRVFVVGLVLFSVVSLVCGLSGSAALLVAARAAQGFGAAVVTPAALSILTGAFPERGGRSWAVGFWTAAQAGGGASGWILGGFLAQGPGWEWVFLSTLPVGVLGVLLAPLLLRESSDPSAPRSSTRRARRPSRRLWRSWSTPSRGRKRRVSPPRVPSVL
jgi:MFS family permease